MRIVFAVPCLLLIPLAFVRAQAPFPGAVQVDGGWVPCDHPIALSAGKGCGVTQTTPAPPPPQQVPTDATCPPPATFNPYTASPAEVLACLPRPLLPFEAADGTRYGYVVGEVYGPRLYPTGERVLVLGVAPDVTTPRRVVTVKWLRGPKTGELAVFYEDEKRFLPLRADER
jgi:hypothetical protein